MKRSKRSPFVKPGYLLLILVTILAIGWAFRAIVSTDGTTSTEAYTPRIVVIGAEKAPSTAGALHGTLVNGELPSGTYEAEVLTDRDCAPDAEGVSHCLNDLSIGSMRLTIRHHHRMDEVLCLRPGETVTVMDEATYVNRHAS